MNSETPSKTRYLKDYAPSAWLIDATWLQIELDRTRTKVESSLRIRRNPEAEPCGTLRLDGQGLELLSIELDGKALESTDYRIDAEGLHLDCDRDEFVLKTLSLTDPSANLALEGLYLSDGMFCTQCEAEGFRRITWYLDRPDVLSRFKTTLVADKASNPVLLSNGNLIDSGEMEGGRHFAAWEDPFPKPGYLFALVAGDLSCKSSGFRTASGREIRLEFYVQPHNLDKVDYAMGALARAMRWDEQRYGREYDLDRYMVVAVDHFNMGAMENKGLNIFNSKYVLASPETATDSDFQHVEGVIGHEYFHNWTGNRITCRDWFQLSLKEGLTVFRDQEFSADMSARALKRIEDVRLLRDHQFAEDAGPMAHPVQPDSYQEINNFYTLTVYNKGAEVVRMLHNLLGEAGFRKGMDLYFERHDGRAVTIEDFLTAHAEATGRDLEQFRLWYSQAGTPKLRIRERFEPEEGAYVLDIDQGTPSAPEQQKKQPFQIPLAIGLIGPDGRDLPVRLEGEGERPAATRMLEIRAERTQLRFTGLKQRPVPSLLRGFSAPVILDFEVPAQDLAFRMAYDSDAFNRWEASQSLALRVLLASIEDRRDEKLEALMIEALGGALGDTGADPALTAAVLWLPAESYIAEQCPSIDPLRIFEQRRALRRRIARSLEAQLHSRYLELGPKGAFDLSPDSMGRRSLRNLCLSYLCLPQTPSHLALAMEQFKAADNMTDSLAALGALVGSEAPLKEEALAAFYHRWQNDPLVVDKWLALQAGSCVTGTLAKVRELMEHPCYSPENPNRVRSLVGAFCQGNPSRFHALDGSGYDFLKEQVLFFDGRNPQLAARLLGPLIRWKRYEPRHGRQMKQALVELRQGGAASPDVREILAKSLDAS